MLTRPLVAHLARRKLYAMPNYDVYRCKGDTHLSIGIVDEKHFWESFCEVVGMEAFAGLPMPVRTAASPVLRPLIARRLRTRTADDWNGRFLAAGVPTWPVRSPAEACVEPHVRARGAVDPEGWMRAPLPGAAHPTSRAPTHGEHTDAILAELGILARDGQKPS
jgi:crotonobetainyl-CoA:carnitine CoA-transferase CaiB-like acyl-CoA transferase